MAVRVQTVSLSLGILVTCIGLFLGLYIFPKEINNNVDEALKLVNGSKAYDRWEKLPIPLKFKVYLFNVSNPEGVKLGDKPVLHQVGPYVYDEYREKYDVAENGDSLLYYENYIYKFNANESHPYTEDDTLIIANLPLMSLVNEAAQISAIIVNLLNNFLPKLFKNNMDIFLKTSPRAFLYDGIDIYCQDASVVCSQIEKRGLPSLKPQYNNKTLTGFKFSVLSNKNNTNRGLFQVNSGKTDISQLGKIELWNNGNRLYVWKNVTDEPQCGCNNICGTDNTIFPPHVTPAKPLHIYTVDVCRTATLYYQKDVTYRDVYAYRYILDRKFLASPMNNTDNTCLCLNKTTGINGPDDCLLDGTMELSSCEGAPLVASFPHFYLAHPSYQEGVVGLNASEELHDNFIDVEPTTGIVLRGSKKIQYNIFYREISKLNFTKNLRTTLMPIFWIDESAEVPANVTDMLEEDLFSTQRLLNYIYWGTTAAGGLVIIVCAFWWILSTNK